jgi:multiple sugar transport system permease protein
MATSAQVAEPGRRVARRTRAAPRRRTYLFLLPYLPFLLVFGVGPAVYTFYLALTHAGGGFAGLANFTQTFDDYRFGPAFVHAFTFVGIWILMLVVLVVGLALLIFRRGRVSSSTLRVLYYLPGAFVGAASVLVWLFLLDPPVSPVSPLYRLLHRESFASVITPGALPLIFALIAFWTGAGGWVLVMIGGLNNISREVSDAAVIDGCNSFQRAVYIELPLLRKWIAFMAILAFAGGTQLFVEPQLVGAASLGVVPPWWSPNQLAYTYAFQQANFNGSAAIAVELLMIGCVCAALVVLRTGLFDVE